MRFTARPSIFVRNDVMDADSFFHAVTRREAAASQEPVRRQPGRARQKGQSFFFVNYEGIRQSLGETMVALVPACNLPSVCMPTPSLPAATQDGHHQYAGDLPLAESGDRGGQQHRNVRPDRDPTVHMKTTFWAALTTISPRRILSLCGTFRTKPI